MGLNLTLFEKWRLDYALVESTGIKYWFKFIFDFQDQKRGKLT